ncbi:MAG: hypothetical protein C4318_00690 [Acidimicrobiia bacterium]
MDDRHSLTGGLRLFAVYVTLNDEPFIEASLESVYPFAEKIFVLTAYDTTWDGTKVAPDRTLENVLAFEDPEKKICCIKMWCPDEALARNWVMHAALHSIEYKFIPHAFGRAEIDEWLEPPDYFWIVDGDEIYDPESVPHILQFVRNSGVGHVKVYGYVYFRTWNYRVRDPEPFTAFVRPGRYLGFARDPVYPRILGYLQMIPRIGARLFDRVVGRACVPPEVGVFHHPAYVGETQRIANKLAHSAHRHQVVEGWIERVWEPWTPSSRNFHPTDPPAFPEAVFVPTEQLPRLVRERKWPQGYLGEIPEPASPRPLEKDETRSQSC